VAESKPTESSAEQTQEVGQRDFEKSNEIAQNTQPEGQQPQSVEASEAAPVTEENKELPRTGSELLLIALIGVLCLGAGVGMKVLSAKM